MINWSLWIIGWFLCAFIGIILGHILREWKDTKTFDDALAMERLEKD